MPHPRVLLMLSIPLLVLFETFPPEELAPVGVIPASASRDRRRPPLACMLSPTRHVAIVSLWTMTVGVPLHPRGPCSILPGCAAEGGREPPWRGASCRCDWARRKRSSYNQTLSPAPTPPAPAANATTCGIAVTVYFTPAGNCTGTIVKALGAAQTSILVQAYSFTSTPNLSRGAATTSAPVVCAL
jgi:hypothetical protein